MASRSRGGGGTEATGPERRMQPASASAVMAAIIEIRNARTTRTGVIPHNETPPVLHWLWLTNRVQSHSGARLFGANPESGDIAHDPSHRDSGISRPRFAG